MPGHFTFFTDRIDGNLAFFEESESRHMIQVLRYSEGAKIEFTDGSGRYFNGVIVSINKKTVEATISEFKLLEKPRFKLGVGILKNSDRMEWLVEKTVELGVSDITFLKCTNTERDRVSIEKLQKTAIAALKQSHGAWLPEIKIQDFKEFVSSQVGDLYIAHCDDEAVRNTPKVLKEDSLVLIGPEGDFTAAEIDLAKKYNFKELALGSRILRAETAALAACVAANFSN